MMISWSLYIGGKIGATTIAIVRVSINKWLALLLSAG